MTTSHFPPSPTQADTRSTGGWRPNYPLKAPRGRRRAACRWRSRCAPRPTHSPPISSLRLRLTTPRLCAACLPTPASASPTSQPRRRQERRGRHSREPARSDWPRFRDRGAARVSRANAGRVQARGNPAARQPRDGAAGAALDPYRSKVRLVQAWAGGQHCHVFDMRTVAWADIAPLFDLPLAIFNAVFEVKRLIKEAGIAPAGRIFDVMTAIG